MKKNSPATHISYAPKEPPIKNQSNKFTQKEITFNDTPLFFPQGFEKPFLVIYFIALPYITGLLFLFFYVAEGSPKVFLSLNEDSSFILTWAIGYEILAGLIILYIIKMALDFSIQNNRKNGSTNFKRP